MLMLAAATWFCFQGSPICYDTSRVVVKGHTVATVITEEGVPEAAIIIDCAGKTHTVTDGKESVSDWYMEGSVADLICKKHLESF